MDDHLGGWTSTRSAGERHGRASVSRGHIWARCGLARVMRGGEWTRTCRCVGVAGCPRDWIGRYVDAHDWLVGARERPGVYFVRALWAHVGVHV